MSPAMAVAPDNSRCPRRAGRAMTPTMAAPDDTLPVRLADRNFNTGFRYRPAIGWSGNISAYFLKGGLWGILFGGIEGEAVGRRR